MHPRTGGWQRYWPFGRWRRTANGGLNPKPNIDVARLENRTLLSATPLTLDALNLDSFEDDPQLDVELEQHFSVDDSGRQIDYSVEIEFGAELIEAFTFDEQNVLQLNLAENRYGDAAFAILADGGAGNRELLPVNLSLESGNDAPTTTGILDRYVTSDAQRTVIDLHAVFDDVEDGPEGLRYTVVNNSNVGLFESVNIDHSLGQLILDHVDGVTGVADLTVIATDSGGLSVGMQPQNDLKLLNQIYGVNGTSPDTNELGMDELDLWTGWRFFDPVNGVYQTDELSTEKFERYLTSPEYTDPNVVHVFNIETDDHVNTAEGRDNFAELLNFSKTVNPDLEIGVYRIMPEKIWNAPTHIIRGLDHQEMGISTFSSRSVDYYQDALEAWKSRNQLYRTETVSAEYGGGTVAELVDHVNPSLYTPKLDFLEHWRPVVLDDAANTLTIGGTGPSFDNVELVQLKIANDAQLENGLEVEQNYYVINLQGDTFQISDTPNGPAIDFGDEFSGRIFAAATGDLQYTFHDSNVRYWHAYAESSVEEARKFGKPVYAWISPSIRGLGVEQLSYDFFRWQLEVLRPIVDGIVVYQTPAYSGDFYTQQSWWQAIDDFHESLTQSANEFRISVGDPEPDGEPLRARGDYLVGTEDRVTIVSPSELLANDAGQGPLSFGLVKNPQNGKMVQLQNGDLRYLPNSNFVGEDVFWYRASDGVTESNAAWVRIEVTPVNDRPVALNDSLTAYQGESLTIVGSSLLANDSDIENDSLLVRIFEQPENGSIVRTARDTFVYQPDEGFSGTDEFVYQAFDGQVRSLPAVVSIDVQMRNHAPEANDDRFWLSENRPFFVPRDRLLLNDQDLDGDPLSVVVVQAPSHGTLNRNTSGSYIYVPDETFAGQDEFHYRAFDGQKHGNLAKVTFEMRPVIDPPVARPDSFVTEEDTPFVLREERILQNDGGTISAEAIVVIVDSPEHGSLQRNRNGAFVYRPDSDFYGQDQFTYQIQDGTQRSEVASVSIQVTPVNDRPIANLDTYHVLAGQTLSVNEQGVLVNDRDADNDGLRSRRLLRDLSGDAPRYGSVELALDGSFTYQARPGFVGSDQFRYVVFDGQGGGSIGTVEIQVLEPSAGEQDRLDDDDTDDGVADPVFYSASNDRIAALLRLNSST